MLSLIVIIAILLKVIIAILLQIIIAIIFIVIQFIILIVIIAIILIVIIAIRLISLPGYYHHRDKEIFEFQNPSRFTAGIQLNSERFEFHRELKET